MILTKRHLSTGFNNRRITPTGLMVHYVSALYTKPDDPYNVDEIIRILEEYKFAYHALICRTREEGVIELVPLPLRAWHAGVSEWHGRPDCNSWMIGVALVGKHGIPFTNDQYDLLVEYTAMLVQQYPIRPENIIGHEHGATPAGRKVDPGPSFNWMRYRSDIGGLWPPVAHEG